MKSANTKYLIIGNSTAATGCVEGIRQIDKSGSITIVSDEVHHSYSRPLISYYLEGKVTEEKMMYRGGDFYSSNNAKLLSGLRVTEIIPAKKVAVLSDASELPYDKLLVAAGSRAFVPPIPGIDTVKNKSTFMTLDDAKVLDSMLGPEKDVLIMGAGLIGLKCAEGILNAKTKRCRSLCIVDLAPRVLASILDDKGAALVQERFKEKGVKFLLSKGVSGFETTQGRPNAYRALLSEAAGATEIPDNAFIDFDILVLAAGVRPNTELLSGIAKTGRGIIINEKCESSAKDIYAAGDCTESMDASSGESRIMALLPNAYMQGECAGVNMAGGKKVFDKAIPMNAIGFMGLHIITAGNYSGDVYESSKEGVYRKLFFSDNKLNGYIFIGDIEKAGIYTSLIRDRTPLDTIDFALICERPGLMAFTKEVRAEKLGGRK